MSEQSMGETVEGVRGQIGSVKMMPLFEVTFGTRTGERRMNELLPAAGFETAQARAKQIAEEHGWTVMGVQRSPWRVITEFQEFV